MNFTNLIGYLAAFGTTVSFIPQAIKTIRTKDTSGISLLMYLCFITGTTLWLVFGLLSHAMPVVVANVITTGFAAVILVYKIRYK